MVREEPEEEWNQKKKYILKWSGRNQKKKYILKWSGWNQKKKMYLKMVRVEPEKENAF